MITVRESFHSELEIAARICVPALVAGAACVALAACSAPAGPDTVAVAQFDIAGDRPGEFSRDLAAGTYLVAIDESGVDVRATVSAGDASTVLEDPLPRHGRLLQVVSLEHPAALRVRIASADYPSKRGGARLSIARFARSAGAPPDDLERGYTAMGAAYAKIALDNPTAWTAAVELAHQGIAAFDAGGNVREFAQAQYSLGFLEYMYRLELGGAIRAADAAIEAFDEADDPMGGTRAQVLRALADLEAAAKLPPETRGAEQRALFDRVERKLRSAVAFFDEHGAPVDAQFAMDLLTERYYMAGDHEAAEAQNAEALQRARANQDQKRILQDSGNAATFALTRGDIARAADAYTEVIAQLDRRQDPQSYGTVVTNLANCLILLGDFDRALALHTETLQLWESLGDASLRGMQLSSIGAVYFRAGNAEHALATFQSALALMERGGDAQGRPRVLRLAANAALELGRQDLALDYLRRALSAESNPRQLARTRVQLARTLRLRGDLRGAAREISQALEGEDVLAQSGALVERALLAHAEQKYTAAATDLRAANKLYESLSLDFDRITTSTALSRTLLAAGDVAGALAAADAAVSLVIRMRIKSANPELRAGILSARYAPFEARLQAELAAHPATDAGALWRAFSVAEAVRAHTLAEQMASRGDQQDSDAERLRAQLSVQQLRLEERLQRADPDTDTLDLRRQIEETRAKLNATWARTHSAPAASADLISLPPLAEIQARIPADTAVLAYFVGDDATHAWLVTRDTFRHASLAPGRELRPAVDAFIAAQRTRADSGGDRALARRLLGPLLNDLRQSRLLIIADGPLHAVPFAALPMPQGNAGELLIDRFVLAYAHSLQLALTPASQHAASAQRIAVVADPVYAADDRRLRLASAGSGETLRSQPPTRANRFPRLTHSALEARAVLRNFEGTETFLLSGFDATPQRVLALPADGLAVLHFATHAKARDDSPGLSSLYLSEYTADGASLTNSAVTASDIARSGLHAEVVVLSGCATGKGSELRGEGVLGLTHSFLANGSGAVVASLWPIEDASTASFMTDFYRAYRDRRQAAVALREAQLRARARAAPGAWSSFVVRANALP